MFFAIVVVAVVVSLFIGVKYGKTLESDAYKEYSKLRAALAKTGIKYETYLAGDVKAIQAEAAKVLNLPKDVGTFVADELKAVEKKL